jgi:hypothetical protein
VVVFRGDPRCQSPVEMEATVLVSPMVLILAMEPSEGSGGRRLPLVVHVAQDGANGADHGWLVGEDPRRPRPAAQEAQPSSRSFG